VFNRFTKRIKISERIPRKEFLSTTIKAFEEA
jgi:hypothetical protein